METTTAPTLFGPPTTEVSPASVKTITWPTNYNNKMACTGGFIHIDLAPSKKPVRSNVEEAVINIYAADNSHPMIKAKIFDMAYIKLKWMPCSYTLASHGLDELDFAVFIMNKYPGKVEMDTELAVYYYKKVVR